MKFEILVATRYLKAKRKQAVISLITIISVLGVAAGVAALIVALAINAGFREDLENKLLGAQAHVQLTSREGGITDYVALSNEIQQMPGVIAAAPSIHQPVLLSSRTSSKGVVLKGIIPEAEARISALSDNIVEGSLANFHDDSIVLGKELARSVGVVVGDGLSCGIDQIVEHSELT